MTHLESVRDVNEATYTLTGTEEEVERLKADWVVTVAVGFTRVHEQRTIEGGKLVIRVTATCSVNSSRRTSAGPGSRDRQA